MSGPHSFFLDTVFVLALLNRNDQHHLSARAWLPAVRAAKAVWLTEAILTEIGNGLSTLDRKAAVTFIRQAYRTENLRVVTVDTPLLQRALSLYERRHDKLWGMTDCISFLVMDDQSLRAAVTADIHFVQAGYRALMLE